MRRFLYAAALCLVIISPAAFAGGGRYRVTLGLLPGDELQTIEQQIAAVARGSIESSSGNSFVLVASDSAVNALRNYPRVAAVEPLSAERPALLAPNSTTTWT